MRPRGRRRSQRRPANEAGRQPSARGKPGAPGVTAGRDGPQPQAAPPKRAGRDAPQTQAAPPKLAGRDGPQTQAAPAKPASRDGQQPEAAPPKRADRDGPQPLGAPPKLTDRSAPSSPAVGANPPLSLGDQLAPPTPAKLAGLPASRGGRAAPAGRVTGAPPPAEVPPGGLPTGAPPASAPSPSAPPPSAPPGRPPPAGVAPASAPPAGVPPAGVPPAPPTGGPRDRPLPALPGNQQPGPIGIPDIEVPAEWVKDPGDRGDAELDLGDGADDGPDTNVLDRAIAEAFTNDDQTAAGPAPEVELSDTEVAQVLSGRVIPIGSFFGGGQSSPAGQAADPGHMAGERFLADAGRIVLSWAEERYLGLTSACGIGIALAVCAAAWFSAGTRADIVRGVAALWVSYLVLRAGQWLVQQQAGQDEARGDLAAREEAEPDQGTGGAEATTSAGPDPDPPVRHAANAADRRRAGPVTWLAALGRAVAESVVYAGLALGAVADRWSDAWTLAIAVLSLVAVRNLMTACSTPPGFSEPSDSAVRGVFEAVLTMPIGGRFLVVGIVAPFWGPRAALLALLDWAIVSIGYGIAGRVAAGVTARAGRRGQRGRVAAQSKLVRLRDDGALARALGLLVQGNLMPLPPAILGLVAITALAFLGLHGLPGALLIGPAVVMLLAAPGSAHPHAGRFDWLVPVLLLGAQCLYLTAIGLATRVPGPLIYALIATLLLRYTDIAWPDRPVQLARPRDPDREPVERGTGLGWEGRLLFAGLAAAMGVATYAYVALAAYLGLLLCAKVVTICLAPQGGRSAGGRAVSD